MKNNRGFSLFEMLVTMAVFLLILMPVYLLIFHYGDIHRTENSRIKLHQESRFMLTNFSSELKNIGTVLTLAKSGYFLKETPYFNGVVPLNNNDYADGIIVATGDEDAVTKLHQEFDAGAGGLVLNVEPGGTEVPVGARSWDKGDVGIVIGSKGYFVFAVCSTDANPVTANTIKMRASDEGGLVYYSGLLSTIADVDSGATYNDPETGDKGNEVIYEKDSPVVRLSNFSIYLFKTVEDPDRLNRKVRQLIRITDAKQHGDVLNSGTNVSSSIVSEHVWDMQISYTLYPNFPDSTPAEKYFSAGTSYTNTIDLLNGIREKKLKEIGITIAVLTDTYGGKANEAQIRQTIPVFGDLVTETSLPEGKYGYKLFSFGIEVRNYNIIKQI